MGSDLPRIRDPERRRENNAKGVKQTQPETLEASMQTNYLHHIALRLDRLVEIMEGEDGS